jgi:ABC-type polysaccharide/polyol phosphate transport system ATPase subunit
VIEVKEVSKVFRLPHHRRRSLRRTLAWGPGGTEDLYALRQVSLRVAAGEFVGLVGRNGSGKSTLLRVVAGIYPPTAGSVHVAGGVAPILDLGVGFHGMLPVSDNVFLYGVLLGIPRRKLGEEIDEILAAAGLERFRDARLETLSTGMKMRLAFSVALRAHAPVLLIDEALAVGDEAFRERCLAELLGLREQGRTALVVSHDTAVLEALCDRLVVLQDGVVRGDGAPVAMIALYRSLQKP